MTGERDYNAPSNPRSNSRGRLPARRGLLRAAFVASVGLSLPRPALAEGDRPSSEEPPEPGDLFVVAHGNHAGETIAPSDIPLGGPQISAWPMDPKSKVIRKGSPLNQVLLLRLEPQELDEHTAARSADGIVAYSGLCTHAGCPVIGWVKDQGTMVLKCFCHQSEFDPRHGAAVVFGPAPRHLAALPVEIVSGTLTVAGKFIGSTMPEIGGGYLPDVE
jgi:rieske iron-sulfur protein